VAVAVEADEVAGRGDPHRQLRTALDLLADEEEDGTDIGRGQDFEYLRRPLRVGSVVERERDSRLPGKDPHHPEVLGGTSKNRREQAPRRVQGCWRHAGMIDNRTVTPQLDTWLADPAVRVAHARSSRATADALWRAAREIELRQTRMLGRLIRWRIPGLPSATTFDALFRQAPFAVLDEGEHALISGLVGRIWTLRRDYPDLTDPGEFRDWSEPGTAKVLFAHWVEGAESGGARLHSETRVKAFGAQGRLGLASVRPLISGFQNLVTSDAMALAVRQAERR
jgi:hypothetical protein